MTPSTKLRVLALVLVSLGLALFASFPPLSGRWAAGDFSPRVLVGTACWFVVFVLFGSLAVYRDRLRRLPGTGKERK